MLIFSFYSISQHTSLTEEDCGYDRCSDGDGSSR